MLWTHKRGNTILVRESTFGGIERVNEELNPGTKSSDIVKSRKPGCDFPEQYPGLALK